MIYMKKIAFFLAICLLVLSAVGCSAKQQYTKSFFFMDTVIDITLYTKDKTLADRVFSDSRTLLSELDALWSRTNAESEVSRFNAADEKLEALDSRTVQLLKKALSVSQETIGAFDITVAPFVKIWEEAEEKQTMPSKTDFYEARSHVGFGRLKLNGTTLSKTVSEVSIDLGGIGKGEAIGLLLALLESSGVSGGLVSFGSNVAVFGNKPSGEAFHVALQDPHDANATVGTLTMSEGQVLSVSGDYERFVTINNRKFHHILDPENGLPADTGLSSVAVLASDGAIADALSTALFVMGKDRALAFYRAGIYEFEAILIESDGTLTATDGLSGIFAQG